MRPNPGKKNRRKSQPDEERIEKLSEAKLNTYHNPGQDQLWNGANISNMNVDPLISETKQKSKKKETSAKKSKDRIIVSKLAKSDRPLWDKSPENKESESSQFKKQPSKVNDGHSSLDYRLTLNRNKMSKSSDGKFRRSVSQPGPPPNSNFILDNISFDRSADKQVTEHFDSPTNNINPVNRHGNGVRLKRSNTMLDDITVLEIVGENILPEENNLFKKSIDPSEFDNLGYDRSPDLGWQTKGSGKRQQKLQSLKDQIQCQLKKASSTTASSVGSLPLNATGKKKSRKNKVGDLKYQPMNEGILGESNIVSGDLANPASESDSDCSSDTRRQSPPTQVQSLSEESSGCSTRRRTKSNHNPSSAKPSASGDTTESGEEVVSPVLQYSERLFDSDLGKIEDNNITAANSDTSDSSDLDTKDVPQFAANPYVKLPPNMLQIPTPQPRTSLNRRSISMVQPSIGREETIKEDKGCDSDSTLDRPIHLSDDGVARTRSKSRSRRQRRGRDWSVPEHEDTGQWICGRKDDEDPSDWEVKGNFDDASVQLDFLEKSDNLSIITDGVEQQMMY